MPRNTQTDDDLLPISSLNDSIYENEHAPVTTVPSYEDRQSARYSQETDEFDSDFPQLRRPKVGHSSSTHTVLVSRQSMPVSSHLPLNQLDVKALPPPSSTSSASSKSHTQTYKILHTQSQRNPKFSERSRREVTTRAERDKKPLDLDLDAAAHVANLGGGGLIGGSTSPLLLERGPGAPDFDKDPAALLGEWGVGPGVGVSILRRATISGSAITATTARNRRMRYLRHGNEFVESGCGVSTSKNSRGDEVIYTENGTKLRKPSWRNNVPLREPEGLDMNSEVLYNNWMRRCCPSDRVNHHEKIRKMLETVLPSKFNKRCSADRPEIPKQELEENLWKDLRAKLLDVSLERHRELLVKQRSDNEPLKKALLDFTIDLHFCDKNRLSHTFEYVVTDEYVKHVIVSRDRVEKLLDRVDRLHGAYCNSFHLVCYDSDWCEGGELDERLRCLRLWLNLLNRLCAALDSVEKELRLNHGALQPLARMENDKNSQPLTNFSMSRSTSSEQTQTAIAGNRVSKVTFYLEKEEEEEHLKSGAAEIDKHDGTAASAAAASHSNSSQRSSVYHEYLDRQLRKNKLRVVLQRLHDLVHLTLVTCQLPLRLACCGKLAGERSQAHVRNGVAKEIVVHRTMVSPPALLELPLLVNEEDEFNEQHTELELYGAAFGQFAVMRLPSLLPLFVKLAHVLLDVMRECLDVQCRARGEKSGRRLEPLSLMCNIVEFREVLKYAIVVRRYFTEMVCGVLCAECNPKAQESLEKLTANEDMESYDVAVSQTMELFFHDVGEYLELFTNLVEPQRDQALLLEKEWRNIKKLMVFFPDGQHDAIKRFCMLTTRVLNSLREFLDSTVESVRDKFSDESVTCWQDGGTDEYSSGCDGANCASATDSTTSLSSSFEDPEVNGNSKQDCRKMGMGAPVSTMSYRLKATFYTARDGMMQAIGVARLLLRELELFSAFQLAEPSLLPKLFAALRNKHVLLKLKTHSNPSLVYFAPVELAAHLDLIQNLLQPNFSRAQHHNESTQPCYLLLLSMESLVEESVVASEATRLWREGATVEIELNADNHITLSHLEIAPGGLLLLAQDSSDLEQQRKFFARNLWHGSSDQSGVFHLINLVKEQCSGYDEIAEKLSDLKEAALGLTGCLHDNIKKSVEKADLVQELSQADTVAETYRKTLYKCFSVGFDYHRELSRLFSDTLSQKRLAEPVRHFALLWLHFVKNWCPVGSGVVPPWCEPGLLFLQDLALHPQYAEFYSNAVWDELLECSNDSICHVVGTPSDRCPIQNVRSISSELRACRLACLTDDKVSLNIDDLLATRHQRVTNQLQQLELKQDLKRNECSIVQRLGRVIDTPREGHTQLKDVPRVSFNWTRVKRLGSGTYGQVFLVKTSNQRMMAMKVMPRQHLGQGVTSSMRQLAEETKLFTSLNHDNLVRYYGVQVLQDDMSIFMEYCKGGTLQSAARTGLDRMLIQQYTREVLQGLCSLHERGIVHRDVKPANVFLTGEKTPPLLKLGDFGSFAKLQVVGGLSRRSINRAAFDTACGPTGTERYMAPEIIREENPVQYASDIWSAGCLVWELFTGKAPWASYGSEFQVMMLVGDFTKPEDSQRIRSALPEESATGPFGYDFMSQCLRVNPSERPSAAELVKHPFCKVLGDGESVSAF